MLIRLSESATDSQNIKLLKKQQNILQTSNPQKNRTPNRPCIPCPKIKNPKEQKINK